MNKILKRDEYVSEIYIPLKEETEYRELQKVNEGLLKNLFGVAKNMFKGDWDTIKGDKSIIDAYKELDDQLSGFTMMKLSKKGECNQIRQELVEFAEMLYDKKKNSLKDGKTPKMVKKLEFKDDALREGIEKCQNRIKEIAGEDEQMKKWANILLNDMKIVINKSIINEIDDEDLKKEIEDQNAADLKKQEDANKQMEKNQQELLKKVNDERKKLISDSSASPVDDGLLGDKMIQNAVGGFEKITKSITNKDDLMNVLKSEGLLGLKNLYTEDTLSDDNMNKFKQAYGLMDMFYNDIKTKEADFKETPGQSVQAMCISVNSFIKNSVYGGDDYGKEITMMAKCAITSNGAISYNLPASEKENGESDSENNYFTGFLNAMVKDVAKLNTYIENKWKEIDKASGKGGSKSKKTSADKSGIALGDDFKKNAELILNKIQKEAKKLKEIGEKQYNDSVSKLKMDEQ